MIKVESLKDQQKILSEQEFLNLIEKIYQTTKHISTDYPDYQKWFYTKQIPGILKNERNILFIKDTLKNNQIIAIASLKKTNEEQKICTLYVDSNYRNLGIGTKIIEESLKWLETKKPLITFSETKINMYLPLIEKYNWHLTEIVNDLYQIDQKEYCYNGRINNNIIQKPQKTRKITKKD